MSVIKDLAKKENARCYWCGAEDKDLKAESMEFRNKKRPIMICSDECREKLKDFAKKSSKTSPIFAIGFVTCVVVGIILAYKMLSFDGGALGIFILFVGNGILLVKYPFVTINLMEMSGAENAAETSKKLGITNIILGTAISVLLFFFNR